jgi:hypothetical protein
VANFEHLTGDLDDMRIAIITESFPPDVNGVAHCVVRVAENLAGKGHHPLVIAPEAARASTDIDRQLPYPVERMPSVPLPGYPSFRLGLPTPKARRAIADLPGVRLAVTGGGPMEENLRAALPTATFLGHLVTPGDPGAGGAG